MEGHSTLRNKCICCFQVVHILARRTAPPSSRAPRNGVLVRQGFIPFLHQPFDINNIYTPSLPCMHISTNRKNMAENKHIFEVQNLCFHVFCLFAIFMFGGRSNYWGKLNVSLCLSSPFPSLMILDVHWYRCTVRCPDDAAIAAVPVLECSHVQHRSAPLHRLCYSTPW